MKFIVSNNHPFSIVEEEPFIEFCRSLNPNFTLMSATAMKKKIHIRYLEGREIIRQEFLEAGSGKLSFTTDL